ncbi:NUDIX domain-containing protein [Leifsonia shinshuensis]|uniref:NUDIX hydrolase n=1 Tax=Leifsonia TaxID=110932 RepID=UPI0028607CF5|nr:NUDIX domain-containing protein [Leifsonia shinshuensis]MDR6970614.1 8-oxo-dGTP pyrophosphatase MutT (NUDIX family) [Leifsonia shinshuensis]
MRTTYPAAVYLCLFDGDRLLLQRRMGTGYRDGELSLPAGHVEPGESATAAVLRETREEIRVELDPGDVRLALVQHGRADGDAYIDFFFVADLPPGAQPTIGEPDKASELVWAHVDALPADVIPVIRNGIEALLRGETYTEYGW